MNNVGAYTVKAAQSYFDSVDAIRQDDQHADKLPMVIAELQRKPFHNPKLQTHDLKGIVKGGLKVFASYVGGNLSDRRIVWQVANHTILVLLYGRHAIYNRVKRLRIDFDDRANQVLLHLAGVPTPGDRVQSHSQQAYHSRRQETGTLFILWDDAELRSFGLPSNALHQLRRLNTEEELIGLESHLAAAHYETALNLYLYYHPHGEQPEPDLEEAEEPEVTAEDVQMERRLADIDTGRWFRRIEPEFMAEVLRKPIEDWMIFLHPDQQRLVEQCHEGPARVYGSAGTGKTVVGLHRAALLAKRNRRVPDALPVLFTTWVKSLPPVLEALYLRMPGTLPDEVEFVHIDELARRLCENAGNEVRIRDEAKMLFSDVYRANVVAGTPLGDSGLSEQYLKAEIDKVIKVQDLGSLEDYLSLTRVGRSSPLDSAQRRQLWDIVERWDAAKAAHNLMDVCDLIPRGLVHARRLEAAMYSAAIVDEAQDLTLAGLQLVRALVNAPSHDVDGADRLMLLGDAAQRIYEGGFTLQRAGVDAADETTTLGENYRNTAEIINAAMAVAGDVSVEDFDKSFVRGEATASTLRQGPRPLLVAATGIDAQLEYILARIDELTSADQGCGPGDIGILVMSNSDVEAVLKRLRRQGKRCENLKDFRGKSSDTVKVGTYQRGKGLEFKVVFLPQVTQGQIPRRPARGMNEHEAAEQRDRQIALLFVAMTRARDLLFVLHDGKPSEPVAAAAEHFEAVNANRW